MPEKARYDRMAASLHWIMAMLVFFMLGLGLWMSDLPRGDARHFYFSLHKSMGLTLFLLVVLRLGWRMGHRPPAWPASMPPWQVRLAGTVHGLLYLLLFLQPISGYFSSSFSGYKTSFWGIPLPYWGWKDETLNELFTQLHEGLALILIVTVGCHVGAALWHRLSPRQENVLPRISPFS